MVKITWSPSSINDLKAIHSFIANDSLFHANKFIKKVIEYSEKLTVFPNLGKIVKEITDKDIRELLCKPYRIIYKIINAGEIRILAIIHSARNWNSDDCQFE